jgi:putative hydrolase of the HAD superfamily
MPDLEAAIFDFGGVLTTPLQESFAEFAQAIDVEMSDLVRVMLRAYAGEEDSLVTDFETGSIDEQEFSVEFARRISEVAGREIEAEGIVTRLFGAMSLEPDMIELVRGLRSSGLKTALLSNSWGLASYPRDLLAELFEVTVISGEVGMRKPDPAIFRLTAERIGVSPESCVFVDDHPGHLKAAMDEGMRTVLHRTPRETIAEIEELVGRPVVSGN